MIQRHPYFTSGLPKPLHSNRAVKINSPYVTCRSLVETHLYKAHVLIEIISYLYNNCDVFLTTLAYLLIQYLSSKIHSFQLRPSWEGFNSAMIFFLFISQLITKHLYSTDNTRYYESSTSKTEWSNFFCINEIWWAYLCLLKVNLWLLTMFSITHMNSGKLVS